MAIPPARHGSWLRVVAEGMKSGRRLIQVGAIGSLVTALCCFTPVLVWLLGGLGLSAILGYLDYVLLPLLLVFVLLLVIGIVRYRGGQ